jgi:protein AbiQ
VEPIIKGYGISVAFSNCTKVGDDMSKDVLKFFKIDMKYVRDLAQKDDIVYSVSPQVGKENRPFVGIITVCNGKKYCIPLSSPKPKHYKMNNDKDFSKIIVEDKLIGVLNFNCMIPVDDSVLTVLDLRTNPSDTLADKHYKIMCFKQLLWCRANQKTIENKANKLYSIVTETPEKHKNLVHRCCDFKKLEAILEKRTN